MNNIHIINLILLLHISNAWSYCELDVTSDFGKYAPLLLNIRDQSFIYPTIQNSKKIFLTTGFKLLAFCPGSSIKVSGSNLEREGYVINCLQNSNFLGPTGPQSFKNIRCREKPLAKSRQIGNCLDGRLIEIGFQTTPTSFARTFKVCYNKDIAWTYWAHNIIPASIGSYESGTHCKKFKRPETSTNIQIDAAYHKLEQIKILREIMSGNEELIDKYMPTSRTRSRFFVRSHLVGRGDQFFKAQQDSTYFYINTVPVWNCINNGNWKLVEDLVRSLTRTAGDLEVYTGGLYRLKLSYSATESREIFLAKNTVTGSPALYVPKLVFKLVFDRRQSKALVFITINNPYLTSETLSNDYQICPKYEKCHQLERKFLRFDLGYTYCCLYQDFMRNGAANSLGLITLPRGVLPLV